jgi:hypothetical protein
VIKAYKLIYVSKQRHVLLKKQFGYVNKYQCNWIMNEKTELFTPWVVK